MKAIHKVKYWLKLNKVNELWMKLCSISDRVSEAEKKSHTVLMQYAIKDADEEELEKSTITLINKINEIETTRNFIRKEINKDHSLL